MPDTTTKICALHHHSDPVMTAVDRVDDLHQVHQAYMGLEDLLHAASRADKPSVYVDQANLSALVSALNAQLASTLDVAVQAVGEMRSIARQRT